MLKTQNFLKDGFPIYGRYLDTTAPGYTVSLDDCGGHIHSPDSSNLGYHYHSQVLSMSVNTTGNGLVARQVYTAYIPGPYKCKSLLNLNAKMLNIHSKETIK